MLREGPLPHFPPQASSWEQPSWVGRSLTSMNPVARGPCRLEVTRCLVFNSAGRSHSYQRFHQGCARRGWGGGGGLRRNRGVLNGPWRVKRVSSQRTHKPCLQHTPVSPTWRVTAQLEFLDRTRFFFSPKTLLPNTKLPVEHSPPWERGLQLFQDRRQLPGAQNPTIPFLKMRLKSNSFQGEVSFHPARIVREPARLHQAEFQAASPARRVRDELGLCTRQCVENQQTRSS